MELLEKPAALTPRPRITLILYHRVLGPNARWHARVVVYGAALGTTATAANLEGESDGVTVAVAPLGVGRLEKVTDMAEVAELVALA